MPTPPLPLVTAMARARRRDEIGTSATARGRDSGENGAGGGTGDMFIELAVETPVNLTNKQKELLREFDRLSEDNNPESSSFFTKVRNFWDGMKS